MSSSREHKDVTLNKKRVDPIDYFYETKYTANTCTKITTLYNTLMIPCNECTSPVDMKMIVKDTYNPTFVILRKSYCISCWCKKMRGGK